MALSAEEVLSAEVASLGTFPLEGMAKPKRRPQQKRRSKARSRRRALAFGAGAAAAGLALLAYKGRQASSLAQPANEQLAFRRKAGAHADAFAASMRRARG